jgi:hypothetical protein
VLRKPESTWSLDRLIDADRFNNDALSCACRHGARSGDLLRRAMSLERSLSEP